MVARVTSLLFLLAVNSVTLEKLLVQKSNIRIQVEDRKHVLPEVQVLPDEPVIPQKNDDPVVSMLSGKPALRRKRKKRAVLSPAEQTIIVNKHNELRRGEGAADMELLVCKCNIVKALLSKKTSNACGDLNLYKGLSPARETIYVCSHARLKYFVGLFQQKILGDENLLSCFLTTISSISSRLMVERLANTHIDYMIVFNDNSFV